MIKKSSFFIETLIAINISIKTDEIAIDCKNERNIIIFITDSQHFSMVFKLFYYVPACLQ